MKCLRHTGRVDGSPCTSADRSLSLDVVIQADGTVERPDSRLHKRDLIRKYGLLPRDLRALDAHVLDVRPALLVTKRSIVLCTPIFRAVLSHDRLLVIPADLKNPICSDDGANELVEAVRETMSHLNFGGSASNKDSLPFELRALEALLIITVRGFKTVTAELSGRVYETIPQLRLGVSPAELKNLMEAKRTCEDALLAGRAFQSALSAVLNSDEDMAAMYLTDRVQGNIRNVEEHETVELILEHMERRIDEANEAALRLQSLLNDVDANLSLVLQSTRVKLQNLELQTAIAALGVASATLVGGFFGMNLVNGYEDHPTAFNWATSGSCGLMAMIIAIGYIRLVRNRRSQLFLRAYIKAKPENLKEIQRGRMGNLDTRSGQASTLTVSRKEYEKKVERVEKERKEAEQRLDEKEKREKAEKGESTQNEKSSPADEQKDGTQI